MQAAWLQLPPYNSHIHLEDPYQEYDAITITRLRDCCKLVAAANSQQSHCKPQGTSASQDSTAFSTELALLSCQGLVLEIVAKAKQKSRNEKHKNQRSALGWLKCTGFLRVSCEGSQVLGSQQILSRGFAVCGSMICITRETGTEPAAYCPGSNQPRNPSATTMQHNIKLYRLKLQITSSSQLSLKIPEVQPNIGQGDNTYRRVRKGLGELRKNPAPDMMSLKKNIYIYIYVYTYIYIYIQHIYIHMHAHIVLPEYVRVQICTSIYFPQPQLCRRSQTSGTLKTKTKGTEYHKL